MIVKVDSLDFQKGYIICDCGSYAHIFSSAMIAKLPKDYNGEICDKCGFKMIDLNMLEDE